MSIPFHRAGIKGGVNPDSFHEKRVAFRAEIVTPENGSMFVCQHGVFVALINAVRFRYRFIFSFDKPFMFL
jgi:hypothetical protein